MLIKAKAKKRLGAGVHPVVIKDISIAKNPETSAPLTQKDSATGEEAVAFDVLFMAGDVGITDRFWLFEKNQWMIDALLEAIGLDNKDDQVPVTEAVGRKLFIAVAKVLLYDNLKPRIDTGSNEQVWYPVLLPKFFKCIDPKMPPRIPGDPQWNNGIASGDFLIHRDSEHGDFFPQQNWYAADHSNDEEAFGT